MARRSFIESLSGDLAMETFYRDLVLRTFIEILPRGLLQFFCRDLSDRALIQTSTEISSRDLAKRPLTGNLRRDLAKRPLRKRSCTEILPRDL